ncbi:MAG TPA: ABC transporter permease [Chloroflexota bacterium]
MARVAETLESADEAQRQPRASQPRLPGWASAWGSVLLKLVPAVLLLLLWELGAGHFVDPYYVSQPSAILMRLANIGDWDGLTHLRITVTEMVVGYILGGLLGALVGYVCGVSDALNEIVEPYVLALYSIPMVALSPLIILWLGIGVNSKIAIALFLVFFTVFYEVYLGVKSLNEEHVNIALLMGASRAQVIRKVVIPTVFPYLMLGLRLGLPKTVTGAVVGEFVAAKAGLGYYVQKAASTFDPAGIFAGVTVLLVLTMALSTLFGVVEKRTLKWTSIDQRLADD